MGRPDAEIGNAREMGVTGKKERSEFQGLGGDPEVVVGDFAAFAAKEAEESRVVVGGGFGNRDNLDIGKGEEVVKDGGGGPVLSGIAETGTDFAEDNGRDVNAVRTGKLRGGIADAVEQVDDDVRIGQNRLHCQRVSSMASKEAMCVRRASAVSSFHAPAKRPKSAEWSVGRGASIPSAEESSSLALWFRLFFCLLA